MIQQSLTAASILVAALLGLLALRQNYFIKKREHTIEFLMSRFTNGYVADLHEMAYASMIAQETSPDGSERIKELSELLNLYEFIALAVRNNILDRDIVFEMREGTIIRIYNHYLPYIDGQRKVLDNNKVYVHLEWLAEKLNQRSKERPS